MLLNDALAAIAADFGLDAAALTTYAAEDRMGGFNHDVNARRWPTGSMWEVEGQFLYALVRAMRPCHVVEIGSWVGCSATHILEAMAVNDAEDGSGGLLTSIDVDPGAGRDIPLSLRQRWRFLRGAAQDVIPTAIHSVDFGPVDIVFEDGPHDFEGTAAILAAVRDHLSPRLVISHDGAHFLVGADIRAAHVATFGAEPKILPIAPSDCGFCYQVMD